MKPQSLRNINPVRLISSVRSLNFSYGVLLKRTFHASGSNKIFTPPHFVKTVCVFILLYIFLRIFFGVMANFSSLLHSLANGASVVFTHEWSFFNHFWLWFWTLYLSPSPLSLLAWVELRRSRPAYIKSLTRPLQGSSRKPLPQQIAIWCK